MGAYRHPGDVPYLERAARESGADPATVDLGAIRRTGGFAEINRHLTALAALDPGGQAAIDSPAGFRRAADEHLARAQAARDRIDLALKAADLAIADALAAFPAEQPESVPEPPPPPPEPPEPEPAEPSAAAEYTRADFIRDVAEGPSRGTPIPPPEPPEPEPAPVPEPTEPEPAELPTAEPADEADVESHSRRRRRNR